MWRIQSRIERLNDLGFDVDELDIVTDFDGDRVRIQPKVVELGHHQRELQALTGLHVEDAQARRLLNDIAAYTAHFDLGRESREVIAGRWLSEIFEPIMAMIPPEARGKLEPAEIFHEVLVHRWYLSERAGREVVHLRDRPRLHRQRPQAQARRARHPRRRRRPEDTSEIAASSTTTTSRRSLRVGRRPARRPHRGLAARPPREPTGSKPNGQLQPVRRHQRLVAQDVGRRAVGGDDAVGEDHRPRAQLEGVRQVVGDEQHRDVQRPQDVGELAARGRVEVGRRLVEHQDLRLHGEHRGDGDPAALAEGEVVRRAVGVLRHPDRLERLRAPGARARRRAGRGSSGPKATSSRTVPMNSWSSGSWKTMPTRRRISSRLSLVTGSPETATLPRPGHQDAVEVQHERGLAGAVGAEQRDPLALVDVEVDAVQRLVAVGVGVGDALQVEDGDAHRTLGHPPVVAPRQHRQVHALAALVGADEQHARRLGDHRPLARVAGA